RAAIDVAAGDRVALPVVVLGDRLDRAGHVAVRARPVAVLPFADVPAVVAAELDLVDLFPLVLADVAGPELAGQAVEAEAPGVAKTVSVDLRLAAARAERVVARDAVGRAVVDVDAEDLAEERRQLLAVALRVAARAAVAVGRVEEAILAERD